MKALYLVLYFIGAACFAVAALARSLPEPIRARLIAAGLLAAVLVPLVELTHTTT